MKLSSWKTVFRFRLRTLLIAVTLLSVWLGFHVRRTERQRTSAAAIKEFGGWIRYDFQFPSGEFNHDDFDPKARSPIPIWLLDRLGFDFFHDVVQVNLNYSEDGGTREENHNPSDGALAHLEGFPNLRILLLSDTQASDSSLRYLAGLKKLERLYMWDVSHVSDDGVAHLRRLNNLRYIHLSSSLITDKSLAIFAEMPKLEGLSLQFNQFSDEGLKLFSHCHNLESLWVCGRQDERPNLITDASLKRLQNLTKLKTLGVQNTLITANGLGDFSKAVPACKVSH
jgi:hypothetical protein